MRTFIVVVVGPARQGVDGLPVVREFRIDQPFLLARPMEALDSAVRFRMRRARADVGELRGGDEQPPFLADELAAVIMHHVRFARPPRREPLERFLHGAQYGIRGERVAECP